MRERPKYDPSLFGRRTGHPANDNRTKTNPHQTPIKDERGLDLQRQVFVKEYSDPGGRGYMNATESAQIAKPHIQRNSAKEQGRVWMKEPEIRSAVEDEFDRMGFGIRRRMEIIKNMAEEGESETRHYNADGELVQRSVFSDKKTQLRALDLSFKLDGSYEKAQAIGAAAKRQVTRQMAEYEKAMMRSFREKNVTAPPDQSPDQQRPDEPPQSESTPPPSSPPVPASDPDDRSED